MTPSVTVPGKPTCAGDQGRGRGAQRGARDWSRKRTRTDPLCSPGQGHSRISDPRQPRSFSQTHWGMEVLTGGPREGIQELDHAAFAICLQT